MKFPAALKKTFNAAARALTPGFIRRWHNRHADDKTYPVTVRRPLTAREAALVRGIFGDEVKVSKVRHDFSATAKPSVREGYIVAATTFGKKRIKFYSDRYNAQDYSQTANLYNFGTFVHEMAHIWQNQRGLKRILHKKLHPTMQYDYDLSVTARFNTFGEEQQASMIEDYARQVLFKGADPKAAEYTPSFAGLDPDIKRSLPLLVKVVEDRFPTARKNRLAQEAISIAPTKRRPG